MYLFIITLGLCLSYFILHHFLPIFFEKEKGKLGYGSIYSIVFIALASLAVTYVSFIVPNIEWGNRILHAFGGGFLAFLVCFLVVKNGSIDLTKFQFFIISALIVSTLGVTNEIIEYVLQEYFGLLSAISIEDTWLDLVSNTIGLLIAAIIFTPFINSKKGV